MSNSTGFISYLVYESQVLRKFFDKYNTLSSLNCIHVLLKAKLRNR